VKSFDPREFPELAANELVCTRARGSGIETAGRRCRKSPGPDCGRFDLTEDGVYLGTKTSVYSTAAVHMAATTDHMKISRSESQTT